MSQMKTIELWQETEEFVQAALLRALNREYLGLVDERLSEEEREEEESEFAKQKETAYKFCLYQSDCHLNIFVNAPTTVVEGDEIISVLNLADSREMETIARRYSALGPIDSDYLISFLHLPFYKDFEPKILERSLKTFLNSEVSFSKMEKDLEFSLGNARVFELGGGSFYYRQAQLLEKSLKKKDSSLKIFFSKDFFVTAAIHDGSFEHLDEKEIIQPLWNLVEETLDQPIEFLLKKLGLVR